MEMKKISDRMDPISVEPTRRRQTPSAAASFHNVLKGGAQVLLAGAHAVSSFVGGPYLSAAIARTRAGSDGASAADSTQLGLDEDATKNLGNNQIADDLKLLAMQQAIQRHDRQIALVSNVMKARHDTAKTAIGNIRS